MCVFSGFGESVCTQAVTSFDSAAVWVILALMGTVEEEIAHVREILAENFVTVIKLFQQW